MTLLLVCGEWVVSSGFVETGGRAGNAVRGKLATTMIAARFQGMCPCCLTP